MLPGGIVRRLGLVALVAATVAATAAGSAAGSGRPPARRHRRHGGSGPTLTVLDGSLSWSYGLDPAHNPQAGADQTLEDAIFGELFALGPGGTTVDDLASGAQLSDGARTLAIDVRRGATFSDGTPFDAAAVAFNLKRDLKADCGCRPSLPVASVSTRGRDTVVLHLSRPDGAIVDQLRGSIANWMVSPTALEKMGKAAFGQAPVGAGPFEVVNDTTNDKLVLRRNPRYWQKGHPHLAGLVFQVVTSRAVGGDQQALVDLKSGTGQAYVGLRTPALVSGFVKAGYRVTLEPSTAVMLVALDPAKPPFDKLKARQAVYRATDAKALDRALNGDAVPVTQSFTGPTGRFAESKVPGYLTYNLHKAKALVRKLGGLRFTLVVNPFLGQTLGAALQSMYEAAGMKVKLATTFGSGGGAFVGELGAFDPAEASSGLSRYATSPVLGPLLRAGEAASSSKARAAAYEKLAAAFAKEALGPFLYPPAVWNVAAKGVKGPGLTTELPDAGNGPAILWQDVSVRGSR